MSLTSTDMREIEVLIRKEIKTFMEINTIKQFEDKLIDSVAKELKRGQLEGEVKEIVIRMLREFYQVLWSQRSFWESRIKSA